MPTVTTFSAELVALLRRSRFRRLFAIRIAGQFGDGVLQAGLASYVFFSPERQTTAPAAAAAFAVLLLPYSVVGPFAGVFLDRWQRRQVLLVTNVLRAAVALIVAGQLAGDNVGVVFIVTVLVMLSFNRFVLAGLSASIPRVVARDQLVLANSAVPTAGAIALMAGLGVGYLVQQFLFEGAVGGAVEASAVVVAALIYLVAGLLSLRLGRTALGPDEESRMGVAEAVRQVAAGVVQGARHVVARRRALWALSAVASSRFFYGLTLIAAILLSRNYFHDPANADAGLGTLALLLGVSGGGFLGAALLTPVVTRWMRKEMWAVVLLAAAAVVVLVPGALFTVPALVVVAGVLGVATQGAKIVVDTVVQESIDDDYRGRVFSFYDMAFNATLVAAAAVAALVLPPTGQSYVALAVVSVGFAVTAAGYHFSTLRHRDRQGFGR